MGMYQRKYKRFSIGILVCLTGFLISCAIKSSENSNKNMIWINEVCSRNFSVATDPGGEYSDYIELYNSGETDVSLDGYYLSDDTDEPCKYALDSYVIPAKDFCVIWLGSTTDTESGIPGFRISGDGEKIVLSTENGKTVDLVSVPKLSYNTSYGRREDGKSNWVQMQATVGETNEDARILPEICLEKPVLSVQSGFYESSFTVKMTAGLGKEIYYTTDGSEPTRASSRYRGGLLVEDRSLDENVYASRTDLSPTRDYVPDFPVDKATVIRAVSYDPMRNTASEIATEVYFVGFEEKEEYEGFPIFSLVTDPENLFDSQTGIYTNGESLEEYKQNGGIQNGELLSSYTDAEGNTNYLYMASNAFKKGKEWEREAVLTYFDGSHEYDFTQNVGIRIAGASTRATPQKSINIYGRDIYDEQILLQEEFWEENSLASSIKLRNGGNANDGVKIIDAFLEELVLDRNVSVQRSSPCILFLNGEYWGIYNIRERYREDYLNNYYGVTEDNIWIIDGGQAVIGDEQAQEAYDFFYALATECDMTYEDVYDMVRQNLDVQSLLDFCCINLYVDNQDVSFGYNSALWRSVETDSSAELADTRWRWMLYDMDDSLAGYEGSDPAQWMNEYCLLNEPVVQGFLKNEEFRQQFCVTLMDIANVNYSYERVHEQLMQWQELYREQTVKNHQRFFDAQYSEEDFDASIDEMDLFFKNRFAFVMKGMAEYFALDGELETLSVKMDPEGGAIKVNTALLEDCESWQGKYFTDYPVTMTALPKEGYNFVGWEGTVTGQEQQIQIDLSKGPADIRAVFEKISE